MTSKTLRCFSVPFALIAMSIVCSGCYQDAFRKAAADPEHPLSRWLSTCITAAWACDSYGLAEGDTLILVERSTSNPEDYAAYVFACCAELSQLLDTDQPQRDNPDYDDGLHIIRGDARTAADAVEVAINRIASTSAGRVVMLIRVGSEFEHHINLANHGDRVRVEYVRWANRNGDT